jgi:hypothetical protein
MTETVQDSAPAPGWYTDPGGSGGQRWWSGQGWTESVQMPAVAPAEVAPAVVAPAAVAVAPVAPLAVSRFGGPVDSVAAAPLPIPASHHRASTSDGPFLARGMIIGLAVGLVVALAAAVFVWSKLSSGGSASDIGGERGPAAIVAAKADATSLAAAEETFNADHQKYIALSPTPGTIELDKTVVTLSAEDTASVVIDPSGVGYCILVVSRSPTTSASSTIVYVSTQGGLLSSLTTTCPANF